MSSAQSTETRGAWLWRKLGAIFGAKFLDMWANVDARDVQAEWTNALHGMPREALQRGVTACYHMRAVPTLPEFLDACRAQPSTIPNRTLVDDSQRTPPDVARARLAEAASSITMRTPGIEWAQRLLERSEHGEPITALQLAHAREALETWALTHNRIEREREPGCDDEDIVVNATTSQEQGS